MKRHACLGDGLVSRARVAQEFMRLSYELLGACLERACSRHRPEAEEPPPFSGVVYGFDNKPFLIRLAACLAGIAGGAGLAEYSRWGVVEYNSSDSTAISHRLQDATVIVLLQSCSEDNIIPESLLPQAAQVLKATWQSSDVWTLVERLCVLRIPTAWSARRTERDWHGFSAKDCARAVEMLASASGTQQPGSSSPVPFARAPIRVLLLVLRLSAGACWEACHQGISRKLPFIRAARRADTSWELRHIAAIDPASAEQVEGLLRNAVHSPHHRYMHASYMRDQNKVPGWQQHTHRRDLPRGIEAHPSALSECRLWRDQRLFYAQHNASAWTSGKVPYHVSSNCLTATAYANVALAFYDDARASAAASHGCQERDLSWSQEVHYVIELGSGHGKLGYHLAHLIKQRMACREERRRYPVCVVLTDFNHDMVRGWAQLPCFAALLAEGLLDFAVLDADILGAPADVGSAASTAGVRLQHSQRALGPGSLATPLLVVANYILDSLPCDAFLTSPEDSDARCRPEACPAAADKRQKIGDERQHLQELLVACRTTGNALGSLQKADTVEQYVQLQPVQVPRYSPHPNSDPNLSAVEHLVESALTAASLTATRQSSEASRALKSSAYVTYSQESVRQADFSASIDGSAAGFTREDGAAPARLMLLPVTTLRLFARLRSWLHPVSCRPGCDPGGMLGVLIGDADLPQELLSLQPPAPGAGLRAFRFPQLTPRPGCFTLPVDFAMLERCLKTSLQASTMTTRGFDSEFRVMFACCPAPGSGTVGNLPRSRLAFDRSLTRLSPLHCVSLWEAALALRAPGHLQACQLLACIRIAEFDFECFMKCRWTLSQAMRRSPQPDECKQEAVRVARQCYTNRFAMVVDEWRRFPLLMAQWMYVQGMYDDAIDILRDLQGLTQNQYTGNAKSDVRQALKCNRIILFRSACKK